MHQIKKYNSAAAENHGRNKKNKVYHSRFIYSGTSFISSKYNQVPVAEGEKLNSEASFLHFGTTIFIAALYKKAG